MNNITNEKTSQVIQTNVAHINFISLSQHNHIKISTEWFRVNNMPMNGIAEYSSSMNVTVNIY